MLQREVNALRACTSIGCIVAVGNVSAEGLDQTVAAGCDLMDNIRRGLETLGSEGPVLVCGSDVPLLTAEAVSDFLMKAAERDVDLAYPVIAREICESAFPGIKRTYVKTADGVFTGGNLMLVKPEFLWRNWDVIAQSYAARKQAVKLARIIGLPVLARFVLGQIIPSTLRLSYIEEAVGRLVGARVAAVISSYPEIGEDVDKQSDLEAVRKILTSAGVG